MNLIQNVYHIQDAWGVYSTLVVGNKKALLVDTGTGMCNLANAVKKITSLPLIVVNTHGHCDHIGGNYQFEQVMLSPLERRSAELGVSGRARRRMLECMLPEAIPECFDETTYMTNSLNNTLPLSSNEVFELGGERVSIVELHNHTEGSVGFLCENKHLLLTGDAVAPFMYLFFPESCSLARHIEILSGLKKDERFNRMLCSHSGELIEKQSLDLFIKCAENAKTGRSVRFTDPIFQQYRGRKHVEISDIAHAACAVIVFNPDKL